MSNVLLNFVLVFAASAPFRYNAHIMVSLNLLVTPALSFTGCKNEIFEVKIATWHYHVTGHNRTHNLTLS